MANKITDAEYNSNWDAMLKMFHQLVNQKAIKDEYEALKGLAKNTIALTPRQREGIIERCNNVINGEYGHTKKSSHIQTAEAFSQNGKQH